MFFFAFHGLLVLSLSRSLLFRRICRFRRGIVLVSLILSVLIGVLCWLFFFTMRLHEPVVSPCNLKRKFGSGPLAR